MRRVGSAQSGRGRRLGRCDHVAGSAVDYRRPREANMDELPPPGDPAELAALVQRADGGEADARDALFTSLYYELHRLAQRHLRRSGGNLTMGATTLLHEVYLDLSGRAQMVFPDQLRFLKYASRAMRGLVIDYVRNRCAQKRGGDLLFTTVDEEKVGAADTADTLEALGRALDDLAALDPDLAELVDLKFFCGFSFVEIAALRGVSDRTVQRDWAKARILLHDALGAA
jgi:RNA polymerase sigma factor (TIGR02999 family)